MYECKKAKYRSQEDAMVDINRIATIEENRKKPINAYLCLKCGLWHLTSKPKKQEIFALKNQIQELKNHVENLKSKLYNHENKWNKSEVFRLQSENKMLGQKICRSNMRINELKNEVEILKSKLEEE